MESGESHLETEQKTLSSNCCVRREELSVSNLLELRKFLMTLGTFGCISDLCFMWYFS